MGVLVVGDVDDTLLVRTGSSSQEARAFVHTLCPGSHNWKVRLLQIYSHSTAQNTHFSLSASLCNLRLRLRGADLQTRLFLVDGDKHQTLSSWLPGLLQLNSDVNRIPISDCTIEEILGPHSTLHLGTST